MAPRTVLHLIDTGGPGGAETIFLNLVTGLDRERWRSVAVVPELDWLAAALEAHGVEPVLLRSGRAFDVRYLMQLVRLVRRQRVAMLQTHLLASAVYGRMAARLAGVPAVSTFHGTVDVAESGFKRHAKNRILRTGAGRLVFVSDALRRQLLPALDTDAHHTEVIHNGIAARDFRLADRSTARADLDVPGDTILVGALGNVRPAKDYATLLDAAALVCGRRREFRFVVAGDTRNELYEGLLARRAALGLEDRFSFAGFRGDVAGVLAALDVFVLPSRSEGFSLATLEALAAGVPVVATRCGGPEEILSDGVDGILVEPGRPELLAAAIERVAGDGALRRELVERGRATVEHRFSRQAMVARYEALYRDCLGLAPARQRVPLQWQES